MYMTLEYKPLGNGPAGPFRPTALNMKVAGPDGPKFARISWDPDTVPIDVDGETRLLCADAELDGQSGYAAFAMQGSRFLSCLSDGAVELRSLKFSQSPGLPGFTADGLPAVTIGLSPEREYIREYLDRNGLFVQSTGDAGGIHALWFYPDVTWEHIQAFLEKHPWNGLGAFCSALHIENGGRPSWSLCYLYAHPEHAENDLSRWKSDDRYAREGA